ncbi:hypothetical protein EV649_1428 [Kribbella sp. VKM Ac-2569]|uniref:hypothetical protein n=1 Tax=Kribbella sp. VKM Ac-2569 TaxID=2512220 RepID=UPI0010E9F0AD|nr:hypothetical protein [Kribbella sp. VKM Ac-2569]RZT27657.1 hypothetical protein EV649_1428 [Kribbella sp. VKM Ac-2569]
MRSPRVIYGVVAGVLVVAGFVLPRYLAGRSAPELGDTVVVPASTVTPTPAPSISPPTTGASPVSPAPARTAGVDDDDDGVDDPDDDG